MEVELTVKLRAKAVDNRDAQSMECGNWLREVRFLRDPSDLFDQFPAIVYVYACLEEEILCERKNSLIADNFCQIINMIKSVIQFAHNMFQLFIWAMTLVLVM